MLKRRRSGDKGDEWYTTTLPVVLRTDEIENGSCSVDTLKEFALQDPGSSLLVACLQR